MGRGYAEKIRHLFSLKILKYAIVGGISTLIHLSVASLFIYFITPSLFQSNIVGFLVAYLFSYFMQSRYVFEHAISVTKASKYFIVQFGSLLLSIFLSHMFHDYNQYLQTILVIIFMPLITFVIHKLWTFKEK